MSTRARAFTRDEPVGIPPMGFDSAFMHREEKLVMIAQVKQEIMALESEGAAS